MHQSCYGITILPAGDWLCNLCIAYSPDEAKNTECVVCSVKGGAMKLCNLRKKSAFKQKIWSQRIRDLDNNEMELEPEMQSPNQNKTNKVNECNTNNTPKIHDTEIIQTPKKSECEDPSDDKNQETIPKLQILNTLQTKALSSPEMNYDNSSKINGISDRLIIEGDLNTVKTDMNQDLKSIESSGSFKISQKETLKSTTLKKKRRIKKKNILKKKKFQESDSKETVLGKIE